MNDWKDEIINIHERAIKRSDIQPWTYEDIRFLALALCGEVGELANLLKKHWRGDAVQLPEVDGAVKDELADIRVYLELLAKALHVDLDAAVDSKLPRIRAKFPLKGPAPEEIARLIAKLQNRAEERSYATGGNFPRETFYEWQAAAALQQMAREKERLKGELSYMTDEVTPANLACIHELEAEIQRDREAHEQQEARHLENVAQWRERIRELEAERDQWKTASGSGELADLCQGARARDDAIKAKTIEECKRAGPRI